MPHLNPEIMRWARETAGLSVEEAAQKLGLRDTKQATAAEKLEGIERGEAEPTRPLVVRMSKQYRRSLLTFYMAAPPARGDRGEDFRTVVEADRTSAAILDALVRDIRARQAMVRAILEEDEDAVPLPFIDSIGLDDGVGAALASMRQWVGLELSEFRSQSTPESAFAVLRNAVEAMGVFVLLIGNLGSHHTTLDVETFRGFALADEYAPFVVINDQDAKTAWAFTLLHELCHLLLGATGVSGSYSDTRIERFCDDVAGNFLLPEHELPGVGVERTTSVADAAKLISTFAEARHLSRSMVAYRLRRAGHMSDQSWVALARLFRDQWRASRDAKRERDRLKDTGPNYYVVRRHRIGPALLRFVSRTLSDGALTPTKAGKVLGVKPRSVEPLLSASALPFGEAA